MQDETGSGDETSRILSLAQQMGSADTPPEETARRRGWIDADGAATDAGRYMLKEIDGQQGTRSVFR